MSDSVAIRLNLALGDSIMKKKDIFESEILQSKISPWVNSYSSGSVIRTHSHPELQILYTNYGDMRVSSDIINCHVTPSQVAIIPPGIEHEIQVEREAEMATIYIGNLELEDKKQNGLTALPASPMLKQLIIRTIARTQDKNFKPQDNIYLLGLLFEEIDSTANTLNITSLPDDKRVCSICQKILSDPLKKVTLAELARPAGASPRTINRIFQRHYGTTFEQWRKRIKLSWAERKIQAGHSVSEVACELGYATTSSFSYAFKRSTGRSPTSLLYVTGPDYKKSTT